MKKSDVQVGMPATAFIGTTAELAALTATEGMYAYDTTLNKLVVYTGAAWEAAGGSGSGDVVGPAGATDGHIAVFNGTTGKLLKDGGAPGSGGAPTTSKYIVSASDANLSAEIVIPGFAGHPDISGNGGAGTSEEFDGNTEGGMSWDSAPATHDSNTTILSHEYVVTTTNGTHHILSKSWSPAGAFDARLKISGYGSDIFNRELGIYLYISNSDNSLRFINQFNYVPGSTVQVRAFSYASSSYTQRFNTIAGLSAGIPVYLRSVRDGSNNWIMYFSQNGLIWQALGTAYSFTMTVAKIGIGVYSNGASTASYAFDWLRTSV